MTFSPATEFPNTFALVDRDGVLGMPKPDVMLPTGVRERAELGVLLPVELADTEVAGDVKVPDGWPNPIEGEVGVPDLEEEEVAEATDMDLLRFA